MDEHAKNVLDWTSAVVAVGTVVDALPAIAALMSVVWTGIRIYEWWKGRKP